MQDRGRAAPPVSLDDVDARVAPPVAADRHANDLELRDRLEKAIAQLPPQQRVLIAAHYLRGVQYEELAEAMNLPLGTVKTQLHRAKRQLRTLLETDLK
jgi:RNA polymerase sigma-70 factor (ECF subfamily)